MIRNGVFCIVNGVEYQFSKDMQGYMLIITKDKTKIDSSFIDRYGSGVYTKKVNEEHVKEIYKIYTVGKVGDLKVNIEEELEDSYVVGTNNLQIAEKLGLEKCDKYYHQGKILKKDIIVSEEKTKIK
jgi:hypothetical protein